MILSLLLIFGVADLALARSADCSLKDKAFSVENNILPDRLDHAVGSNAKLRQSVLIKSAKREHSIVKNGPPVIGFVQGGDSSICTGTAAYILNDNVAAILLAQANPPFADKLMMVVYDSKSDRVIKTEKDLGIFAKVDVYGKGFIYSTMTARREPDTKRMKSPLSGRELSASDHDLGAFQLVTLNKNRLQRHFDLDVSWEKSEWRRFFKDKSEYQRAGAWDAKKKTFKNTIVYQATAKSDSSVDYDETCIQFVSKRGDPLDKKKMALPQRPIVTWPGLMTKDREPAFFEPLFAKTFRPQPPSQNRSDKTPARLFR